MGHTESKVYSLTIRYLIVDTPITRKGWPYENVVSVDKILPWMNFDACSSSDDSDN